MLRVTAMGTVGATHEGVPVDLGGPLQRAVLGLLVAAGRRTVSTDRFLDDLWQGEPPPKALGALQVYVSHLRKALEPDRLARQPARVLTSVAPGYQLALPDEAVDTWHFTRLVREARALDDPAQALARADEAMRLWNGDPFAAYADHAWATEEAARLWDLHADAVQLRAAAALDLGRAAEALDALDAHVQAYPLREQGVRLHALALYRCQRQGDALAALAALRARLADQLGVDPSPELRELELDILHHAPHLRAPTHVPEVVLPRGRAGPAATHDAVSGRSDELERLRVATLSAPGPSIVWVSGEAGIGKTTLVERLCDEFVGAWTVARGRCPEVDGAPPAWAWSGVLEGLVGEAVDPVEARSWTAFDLAHRLTTAIDAAPHDVLLVLDDLHRADGETLQVLRHVLASSARRVVALGTYRSDELSTDLSATLAATAERTVEHLELAGLSDDTARAILEDTVGSPLGEPVLAELLLRAGGNPLFLKQMGRLAASEGPEIGASDVPSALRDILTRRLERLPAATVDLLSRAALLGRDVDVDLLVAMEQDRGTSTEDEVVDALDAGIVAGLLHAPTPGSPRFTHALVRDALYDRLPPMRRFRLHAAALATTERRHPERLEALAYHAAASLDRDGAERAAAHLAAAAEQALRAGAHGDAVRFSRQELEAHDLAGTPPSELVDAHHRSFRALAAAGDLVAAQATRRTVIRLAESHGSVDDRHRVLAWPAPLIWSLRPMNVLDREVVGRLEVALAELDARPDDDATRRTRCALLTTLARETEGSEQHDVAERSARAAVDLARSVGDPALLCGALNARYMVGFPPEPADTMLRIGAELLEVARDAGLPAYEAIGHLVCACGHLMSTDLDAAATHFESAVDRGSGGQLNLLVGVAAAFRALRLLMTGEIDAAAAAYDVAADRITGSGDPNGVSLRMVFAFTIGLARGDAGSVADTVAQFAADDPPALHDVLVCALLDAGREDEARAAWRPDELVRDTLWACRAALRVRNALRLGDLDAARAVGDQLRAASGQLAGAASALVSAGPVDHYLGLLLEAEGDAPGAVRHFAAAAELADRLGARHWVDAAEEARTRVLSR